ncbi:hemoglobin/transferrin/lactoferrin receptor protein [Zunongwangia mangrovi]|uniref:Hemoglobin/transferrin/lactoferrin receptor protein n=1 Tax=Zunongwangia mangrovi TaxID=1334022 RepID=A0A1I1DV10_9FLAO|nr:TonB-dependent receptor [Zunongwangia mangrovi]SFB78667.1 hemoglobin/transferrin/lactoferrin receptor protein [Zunongwangia mangrovi]
MRFLVIFFFIFLSGNLFSQHIIVLDKATEEPLSDVIIFNAEKTKTSLSNFKGRADISKFDISEVLFFQHVSHQLFEIRKSEIKDQLVYLQEDQNKLDQVVLSVAKFQLQKDEIPQKIVSIDRGDVIQNSPQTSADLLESTGQVFVQKSQLGGGSPMIRGFATNRVLISVDGVRMNTAIFRSGNLQNVINIDPLAIERSEVILGPGSVVYGSDAIGGVMNFYTLKPRFSFGAETSVSGNFYGRYSSANNEQTLHADVNLGRRNWAFQTSVSYSDFGDLKMGEHGPDSYLRPEYVTQENGEDVVEQNESPLIQKPTGYTQLSLLEKVKYMPNETWNFNLGLIYSETSDYPRYDRLYRRRNGQLRAAEWYYGPQRWFLGDFKINKKGNGELYDKAQFTLAYQFFEESRHDRDFGSEILFNTEENVGAYSANLDFEKAFEGSKLFYGLEYVNNQVNSEGFQENINSGAQQQTTSRYPDNSSWQSLAAYATYQWQIQEDLNFQSGLRYNHILLNAKFDENLYDFPFSDADINTGALTASAGINWKQNRFLQWRVNASTAFRAPNIDDVGKIFDSEPGSVVVPNPNLKPEYAYNAEIGVNWSPAENIRFGFAGFYTWLEDAMVRRDFNLNGQTEIDYQGEASNIQAIQNASNANVYGFEGNVEVDFSVALRFASKIAITEGEEELDDGSVAPLRHAAPLFGNTHLIWHKKKVKLDLFAEYNGELSYNDLATSEQGKAYLYAIDANGNPYSPSWYTLNLTGQYDLDENWLLTASVENITDQRYRTYSSGIAAAGRNLIISARFKF